MAFPKFGPKTFRAAALGLSALAVAAMPLASGPSQAGDGQNMPTTAATSISSSMTVPTEEDLHAPRMQSISGRGLSIASAHRAVVRDTTPSAGTIPQSQTLKTEIADTTDVAYTSPIYESAGEAQRAAVAYARETGGLGFVIAYGEFENAVDPNELGQRFLEEINKRGAESRYFIGALSQPGISMAFYNGHTVEGPMGPREAASNLSDIVGQHLFYKRQLGSVNPEAGGPLTASINPDNL